MCCCVSYCLLHVSCRALIFWLIFLVTLHTFGCELGCCWQKYFNSIYFYISGVCRSCCWNWKNPLHLLLQNEQKNIILTVSVTTTRDVISVLLNILFIAKWIVFIYYVFDLHQRKCILMQLEVYRLWRHWRCQWMQPSVNNIMWSMAWAHLNSQSIDNVAWFGVRRIDRHCHRCNWQSGRKGD